MKCHIFALILAMGAAPLANAEPGSYVSAEQTVDAFHQALATGDSAAALELLDEQVQIFEQGYVEQSKAEYAQHHLGSDMAFSSATKRSLTKRSGANAGDLAFVISEGATTGSYKGKAINSVTLETMMLRQTANGWRIAHIHWSSRDVKKKP